MPDDSLGDLSVDDNSILHFQGLNRFDRLNHSDPAELVDHEPVIPPEALRLLNTGIRKIEAYPERFARPRDHYSSLLALVATSTWHRAREFSLCGVQTRDGQSRPCHQWNLCPACSYSTRKRGALAAYLTRFARTSWFLVTISYQADFGDGIFDEDAVRLCWQAARVALRDCQETRGIRGAMTRAELHLESFLPTRYFPHVHAVVDADAIDRSALAKRVFAYRCPDTGDRITYPVSIHHRRLTNERAFAYALSYLGKPLELVRPYRAAWPLAARANRRRAPELNAEVNDFLDAYSAFVTDGHQVRYSGTLHHASRGSLRVPRGQRRLDRELVSAILAENNLQEWDEDESEPATVFQPPQR